MDELSLDGSATIKVIAGECLGTKAFIETHTPITYLDIQIRAGKSFEVEIPVDHNCFIYTWRGSGMLGSERQNAKLGDVCNINTK